MQKLNVLLDCVAFQIGCPFSAVWFDIIKSFVKRDGVDLIGLNRGNAPLVKGVTYIDFPSYDWHNTAADSVLIDRVGRDAKADIFLSTLYTTPTTLPSVLLVNEFDDIYKSQRCLAEKLLACHHASYLICPSPKAYRIVKRFVNHRERLKRVKFETRIKVLEDFNLKIDRITKALHDGCLDALNESLEAPNFSFQKEWHRLRSIQVEVDTWP